MKNPQIKKETLLDLINEWERKAIVLDQMAAETPDDNRRLWAKAGVFRSVAVDLKRVLLED